MLIGIRFAWLMSHILQAEPEVKDSMAARKIQKADREKLRRDRLNEQFLELGNALELDLHCPSLYVSNCPNTVVPTEEQRLERQKRERAEALERKRQDLFRDPDRPKNDKATILTDTVQMLKDLTAQVNRLKAEYASLSEESRELTQEKNELREEKAALKSDIDNLSIQHQQRLRVMFPWAPMDPSVVMGPPAYPYPMPVPVPAGPIPVHPSLQPYPFFRNPNAGAIPNPCSTFLPFSAPGNPQLEQPSTQCISAHPQPSSRSHSASKQDSRSKSSDHQRGSCTEKSVNSNDVATDLELKTPGSARSSSHVDTRPEQVGFSGNCPDPAAFLTKLRMVLFVRLQTELSSDLLQELSSEKREGKQWSSRTKYSSVTDESSSSRSSSSRGPHDSSSNSVGDGSVAEK
ncbi:hypothetical protein ACLOJK_000742 [Asimina triloba]